MESLDRAYDWYKDYGSSIAFAEWSIMLTVMDAYRFFKLGDTSQPGGFAMIGYITGLAPSVLFCTDAYEKRHGNSGALCGRDVTKRITPDIS